MSRPWFPFYPGDYLRDTGRLSTEGHGAYLLLILDYWVNGAPPDDDVVLATITRLSAPAWSKLRPTLVKYFNVVDGKWTHGRIEKELVKANEQYNRRAKAGSAGGKANAARNASSNATSYDEAPLHQPQPQSEKKDIGESAAQSRSSLTTPEGVALCNAFLEAIGFPDPTDILPEWCGTAMRAEAWQAAGWPVSMIVATAKQIMQGRQAPPHINYFEKAFANAHATAIAPVPVGKPNGKPHDKTGNIIAAADRLLERVRGFDATAPTEPSDLRDGTGAAFVRTIPPG